ncbi:aldehyde dehydrogenase family protein, partial [Rhizobium sp. 18055]|uniref:aldehyde dehydrogenase family protein n=1 Tax=Rhizobium sp. 18055 TaxID=2681403 RepID=UPI00135977CB
LSSVLRGRSETLATLITAEMGKTIAAARAEIEKCAATIDWIADNGPAFLADEPVPTGGRNQAYVSFRPLGPILGVMPWNFPFWQVIRAAAPIMLSGNAFVLKHAPNVLGSATALVEAFDAAGFPDGLFISLNVDNETVARLIESPSIAAVTLTGSQRAGS